MSYRSLIINLTERERQFITMCDNVLSIIFSFIQNPKSKDAALYKCDVVNELGECIANIYLQFQGDNAGLDKGDQIAPSIIERPKIIKDEAKRTVRFECKLSAKPEAKIKWLKEKKELIEINIPEGIPLRKISKILEEI